MWQCLLFNMYNFFFLFCENWFFKLNMKILSEKYLTLAPETSTFNHYRRILETFCQDFSFSCNLHMYSKSTIHIVA